MQNPIIFACFQPILVFFPWFVDRISNIYIHSRYISKNIDIDIDKEDFENIVIDIDTHREILENIDINIDIDMEILRNIDIDRILYWLEWHISDYAPESLCNARILTGFDSPTLP